LALCNHGLLLMVFIVFPPVKKQEVVRMVIVMHKGAAPEKIILVEKRLHKRGFTVHVSQGINRTVLGVVGESDRVDRDALAALPGVEKVVPIMQPYKLASRDFKPINTIINVRESFIGKGQLTIIAGPCAVEGREKFIEAAEAVKKAGANILRGGAFKPRTSPYSFQGLGEEGLKIMAEARELTKMPIITEVMDQKSLPIVAEYADIIQVGARNMQNFFLLKELGRIDKPVVLKRGLSATIEEWLMAAEYILDSGNPEVILCERGIRTFETYTRNTLDLSAVPLVKQLTHLPVIVDPSHGTGKRELIEPMSLAAVACGSDGIMVEVHPNPSEALSDGPQSLLPDSFEIMVKKILQLKKSINSLNQVISNGH